MPTEEEEKMLQEVLRVAGEADAPALAVGANARFLVLDERYGLPLRRLTQDWDFAVRLESWQGYQKLAAALTQDGAFLRTDPHRFVHSGTKIPIDLIPLGELAGAEKRIEWPETGRSMNVLGFDEAFQHAEEVELAGERIMVATPPWHVALKLFAYSDRAAERDLADIEFILENATEVLSERVFDELSSELADGHLQYDETGPYLLACDLRRQSSTMVIAGLLDVLSGLLDEADHLSLRRHLLGNVIEKIRRRSWMGLCAALRLSGEGCGSQSTEA
ncbi:MAG TPA: nucleotidyl transferase AbiEii/AbiGii toxin family protein [Trueperaceae bacterium]